MPRVLAFALLGFVAPLAAGQSWDFSLVTSKLEAVVRAMNEVAASPFLMAGLQQASTGVSGLQGTAVTLARQQVFPGRIYRIPVTVHEWTR